uniref:Copper-translocating P-type ATPase n=1 Tax=Sinorhizobium sp. M14 TaxID=430451 RepID=A0A142BPK6_9HYPH|nr:copper-translocating P-type ATPase [Sinorhizobium sp. M14]
MKKATLEVRDLFGMLDFVAIEKRLAALPGVASVAMNAGSASATIEFDEARTNTESLAREIETCGFHCRGETVPRHLCVSGSTTVPPGHPRAPSGHIHRHAEHAATIHVAPGEREGTVAAKVPHDAMAHEMGHGAGMDMQDMVSDMRNRFLVSLVFTLPIFAMEPMGMGEPWLAPLSVSAKILQCSFWPARQSSIRSGRSWLPHGEPCGTASSTWRCWWC